ncbi:MAG: metallophosphoesterase [Rectinemataceae bacterium]|jgi:hypothetical protein
MVRKTLESPQKAQPPADRQKLTGVKLLKHVNSLIAAYPGRAKDSKGRPGGLIILPAKPRPIIVGDLHGTSQNLKLILEHDGNAADLESGAAVLVIVGDLVHEDRTGYMKDMSTSIVIFDEFLALFARYPGRVYYIRGNHDTFDERLRKSGIAQGEEFRKALLAAKGEEFVEETRRFFEGLPYFVIGKGFVVTHAGPIRGGCTREELVNIKDYPEKEMQLVWNRVNEFNGNPSPKEYGEKDIRMMLDFLDMPPDTHFIVGHNPLWNDGGKTGVWLDVIGIKNHHIIYSGAGSRAPYFTFIDGEMKVELTMPKEAEVLYFG